MVCFFSSNFKENSLNLFKLKFIPSRFGFFSKFSSIPSLKRRQAPYRTAKE